MITIDCISFPNEEKHHSEWDSWGKENNMTVVFAPWHPNPEYRVFKTGSLLSKNEQYPSGLIVINDQGTPTKYK